MSQARVCKLPPLRWKLAVSIWERTGAGSLSRLQFVIGPLGESSTFVAADKGKRGHLKPKRTPMMQPLPLRLRRRV